MVLEILYKDRTKETINNIFRVSNISTNHSVDYLYYETYMDMSGKGTLIEFNRILCFRVTIGDKI